MALGLSGQGNESGSSPQVVTGGAVQLPGGTVSPSIVFDADIPEARKRWYPMRIAHGRAERVMAIRDFLVAHQVTCFLPLTHQRRLINGKSRIRLVPAVDNLIFIRSVEERLTQMKRFQEVLLPLRYMMWQSPLYDEPRHIITVPDAQMENFMRVASVQDDRVMFLGNKDFSQKIGRHVRITDGPFAGVTGTVYRVRKDRRVVITLEGITSVAISYINPDFLQEL